MTGSRTVEVKARHIKYGRRNDGSCCPVALALRDAGFCCAYVDVLKWEHNDMEYEMPSKAVRWIQRFDAGKPVRPFKFRLTTLQGERHD